MRVMEAAGYTCTRCASSKGAYDVVAVSETDMVLIQVKRGHRPSPNEYIDLTELRVPPNVRKLVHHWPKGSSQPLVITL